MPYSYDLLDEEEQKKQQGAQDPSSGAPAMTGGGESFGSGGPSQAKQGPQEKGAQRQGSGFVGLDKYMNANRGNNFGNQVTGRVRGSVDNAKSSLEQGAQAFTQASNQNTTRWNDVGDQFKGIVDNAGSNLSPEDVKKAQGVTSASYQGPEDFLSTAYGTKAQGDVQKASQQANALQTEGGRFALLDQYFGRPNYSTGEKSLDNLLVQNTPGVAARAASLGNQSKLLSSEGAKASQDLGNLAASNKQATADTATQAKGYLGNAVTGFQSDLDKRFQDYNTGNKSYNDARRADLSDDAWDADTLGLSGLNEGSNLYDLNLSNYLQDSPEASLGQFANDQDYARYLALQQLAGEDPSYLSPDQRGEAGKAASMGRVSLDQGRLSKDIAGRKAASESALDNEVPVTAFGQTHGVSLRKMMEVLANSPAGSPIMVGTGSMGGANSIAGGPLMYDLRPQYQAAIDQYNQTYRPDRRVTRAGG